MSDTPETDDLEIGMDKRDFEPKDKLMPYADLCRKLERERDQARQDELDESKWAKQYFEERNEAELKIALFEQDIAMIKKIIKKGGTAECVLKFLNTPES